MIRFPAVALLSAMFACGGLCGQSVQNEVMLVVLGNVQDAGSPHIGCERFCCSANAGTPAPERRVTSLGLIDPEGPRTFLIEASPDMPSQLRHLRELAGAGAPPLSNGILLTHAHIGHYSGLMYLGREAVNAEQIPVFTMPGMQGFLENNGPWDQLLKLENIRLKGLRDGTPMRLSPRLEVIPFRVPHRDEYSETVGYEIRGPQRTALFIPDIDKWDRWETDIREKIRSVDLAFLDATFYDSSEIGYRDVSEIPHPFVIESRALFDSLPETERNKIHFIHLNHTNPLLDPESEASNTLRESGYRVARLGDRFTL